MFEVMRRVHGDALPCLNLLSLPDESRDLARCVDSPLRIEPGHRHLLYNRLHLAGSQ